MTRDKSGALLIVAEDENSWMQVYDALSRPGRVVRHRKVPKSMPKGFRFMAWSAGMPPESSYIRKTSDILPENTWFDGAQLRYKESNPRYRWISRGLRRDNCYGDEEDDEDDDDSLEHTPGGNCCAPRASRCLGWHGNDNGYYQDRHGNWYDSAGNYMPTSQPCQPVQWALPERQHPPPQDRRGRRFAPMPSPVGAWDDDDNFVWKESPSGRVRYTKQLDNPICNEGGRRRGGVEQFRSG
ncbi:hypothetical protein V2A60_009969 [Cordyceps javanica]